MSFVGSSAKRASGSSFYATLSLKLQQRTLKSLQVGAGRHDLRLDSHRPHRLFVSRALAGLNSSQLSLLLSQLLLSQLDHLLDLVLG